MTSDLITKAAEIRAGLEGPDEFDAPETMSPQDTARDLVDRFRSGDCPFCGHDPYHYVDNGVGMERVAVTCCDLGIALFQEGDEQLSRASGERHEAANALSDLLDLIEQQAAELAEARAENERLIKRLQEKHREVADLQQGPLFKLKEDILARATAAESDRDELLREKERLGKELERESAAHLRTVDERDHAHAMADKLARAIGGEDIGDHSNGNCPWANALDLAGAPSSQPERIAVLEAALAEKSKRVDALEGRYEDWKPVSEPPHETQIERGVMLNFYRDADECTWWNGTWEERRDADIWCGVVTAGLNDRARASLATDAEG